MKKYMVVYVTDDGETCAMFFDTASEASYARRDLDVSLGYYAEVYERTEHGEAGMFYEFAWA